MDKKLNRIEQLIEKLCPDGVKWKALGDVVNIKRGASPRPIQAYLTNAIDGINWLKIGDVSPGEKFINQTLQKITKEGSLKSRLLKKRRLYTFKFDEFWKALHIEY